MNRSLKALGFTLSETTIAVMLIGVLAAVMVPQLGLGNISKNNNKAILKDTIHQLELVLEQGAAKGDVHMMSAVRKQLQVIRMCASNSITEGCLPSGVSMPEAGEPGFILKNGALVVGINDYGAWNGFSIDANAEAPPNKVGKDQILLYYYSGLESYDNTAGGWATYRDIIQPGRIYPVFDGQGSKELFEEIQN